MFKKFWNWFMDNWLFKSIGRLLNIQWDTLTKIGKSKIMAFTILIPFIGYMIIFNVHVVTYLELTQSIFPDESSATSSTSFSQWLSDFPRLIFIYFGLLSLGIASFLYQVRCPQLIKQHNTPNSYVSDEKHLLTYLQIIKLIDEQGTNTPSNIVEGNNLEQNKEEDYVAMRKFQRELSNWRNENHATMAAGIRISETLSKSFKEKFDADITDLMIFVWNNQNYQNKITRQFTAAIFGFGFLLLSLPSIATFLSVSISLF